MRSHATVRSRWPPGTSPRIDFNPPGGKSVEAIAIGEYDLRCGLRRPFTKTEALVRDPQGHVVCTYPRAGGLYKGEMRLRNPLHPDFRRQGQ